MPKIVHFEFINKHNNDPLAKRFRIDKTQEIIGWKYYWPSMKKDIKFYIRECDIYLVLKIVKHRSYGNFLFLPVPTH